MWLIVSTGTEADDPPLHHACCLVASPASGCNAFLTRYCFCHSWAERESAGCGTSERKREIARRSFCASSGDLDIRGAWAFGSCSDWQLFSNFGVSNISHMDTLNGDWLK